MTSIVENIKHYQKSIDRSLNDESRLLHCIGKLYRLPVSVQHLQETGIGRTVNGLRKYDGEVGVAAKALVSKWKSMVAAEESEDGGADQQANHYDDHHQQQQQHQDGDEDDDDNYDDSRLQVDEQPQEDANDSDQEDAESPRQEVVQQRQQQREEDESDDEEEEEEEEVETVSKHRSEDQHRKSSSSKSRDHHEKESKNHHSSSSKSQSSSKKSSSERDKKDKHKSSSDRKSSSQSSEKESSHSSSSREKSSSSKHHSSTKVSSSKDSNGYKKEDGSSSSSKRRRSEEVDEINGSKKVKKEESSEKSSSDKNKSSSRSSKSSSSSGSSSSSSKDKSKKSSSDKKREPSSSKEKSGSDDEVEGLDSSAGASFADALAMIGMPSSSKKKSSSDKPKKSSSSSMPPPAAKVRSEKTSHSSSSKSSSRHKESSSPKSTASSSGYSSSSSSSTAAAAPLLRRNVELDPLPEASEIVEALPIISPHYKPMPLNQTVMGCVFGNNGKPQKSHLTEEEALGHSMQSKNQRTKVYSGVKTHNGVVPSLFDSCIRMLQENIDLLDVTGGVPFDLLKPVLERASPEQLMNLENYNPYLMEDSDILWEQHCKRTFRMHKRKEEECESWREMYIRCSEERDAKLRSLTANIKMSQAEKVAPVRKTQLAYVDSAVKPPRSVISKQARYGTDRTPVVSPAARVAALKNASSNVAKAGDTRLKVAPGVRDTAQAVFQPMKPKKAPMMTKVMNSIKGIKGFRR